MGGADLYISYKVIRLLSTPWTSWEAHKLGLIDDHGKTIKKAKNSKEKGAMTMFHILVKNLKRVLDKLPFGKTKLGSFAAALFLIKEHQGITSNAIEDELCREFNMDQILFESTADEVISPGKYKLGDSILYTNSPLEPIGECLNTNIFRINDIVTNEPHTVALQDITKL